MNNTITSREALLNAAKKSAYQNGLSKINIRRIASDCGVAVGTVYNYFPSKADMIVAILEDFWQDVFQNSVCGTPSERSFPDFFEQLFNRLNTSLRQFEQKFLAEIAQLSLSEKEKGRKTEARYWQHILDALRNALERDDAVLPQIWGEHFTKEQFSQFAFVNLMSLLRAGKEDCSFFLQVLRKLLYQQ